MLVEIIVIRNGKSLMAKSIMIVDDSATMRKIIMRTVRMSGLDFDRTVEAGDGAEALEKLNDAPVDIMLCDINMPEMSGTELVERARQINPDIGVVFITGYASLTSAKDAIKQGALDYIMKPFTREGLVSAVKKILGKPAPKMRRVEDM